MVIEALLTFLASIVAGGFGSLVGIGGGLIIVPVLTIAFGVPIKIAIAASLIGVIATSTGAAARYLSSGIADRRLGLLLLVATAAGGIMGGITAGFLDARTLSLLFGAILVLVALQMLRQRRSPPEGAEHGVQLATGASGSSALESSYVEPRTGRTVTYGVRRLRLGIVSSVVAGNVSGLLGVGGGIINVPTMNLLMGVPLRVATTTSTYMLGATAAASAVIYYAEGLLDPLLVAPVALGVLVGASVGASIAPRVPQEALRIIFIAVSLIFAVQMFARAVNAT